VSRTTRRAARQARQAPARAQAGAPRHTVFAIHAAGAPAWPALTWAGYAIAALYAAAVLVMTFGPHRVGDIFTETDFYGSYGPGARLLQQGHMDPTRYAVVGPVFELLLAGLGFVVRDLFLAAGLIAAAAMTATLLLWRSLLARRVGPSLALFAVLFLACNAQFFRYGWSATTDAPAVAFQAAALWALLGSRAEAGPSLSRTFAAGLLAALAFLTRYNGVALLPAGLLAVALGWNGVPAGARARHALAFAGGFLAPVAPWVAFSAAHGGAMKFQLHHNIAFDVFARPKGIVWDVYERDLESQFPTPWSVLARDPAAVISRIGFNLFDHVRLDAMKLTGWPLALAAAAGAWFAWKDGVLARLRPALVAMALLFLTLVPVFHSERYSLAMLPLWSLLAAAAFASPRWALVASDWWLKLLLVPAVLVPSLAVTRAFTARTLNQLPVEAREAAERVKPLVKPGDKVLARKPHFAWYAGLVPLTLPFSDTLSQWGETARRTGARWLYFSWPEAELRTRFNWLLDSTSAAPGLTVRAVTAHWPSVVYEIGPDFGREPAWATVDTLVAVHRARARVLLDSTDVENRLFLAWYEYSQRHFDTVQQYVDRMLAHSPYDLDVLKLAAETRLQLQDPDGALSYFDRYDRLRPGSPEASIGRGWAAAMKGDDVTAARYWGPVVGSTSDPITLQRMMIVFEGLGDAAHLNEARETLKTLRRAP